MNKPLTEMEIQKMIDKAIFHHEIKFSVFGVLTAALSLLAGFLLSNL